MGPVETMLAALAVSPDDDTAWLALADCLAEEGQDDRAELVRAQLRLRRKPDDDLARARTLELWRAGVEPCLPELDGPYGLRFVLVPPGAFDMGARPGDPWEYSDELPRHRVELTRGVFLSRCQVTCGQWLALMGSVRGRHRGDQHPVESVSWRDGRRFCDRLSLHMHRRCRLPTEAEWEYACRAGTTTLYFGGDDVRDLQAVGWCSYSGVWDQSGGTRPVGTLRPNAFGLFDMHGNVWEWCQDVFGSEYYESAPQADPAGPEGGMQFVVRGGSWRGGPWFCRSSERRALPPGSREINVGFRVAVELE